MAHSVERGAGLRRLRVPQLGGGLGVIALDDERHWYRYHHLFADALRQRPRRALPEVSLLHERASAWFEREGLLEEAIGHALLAGAYELAGDLIGRALPGLFRQGELETIMKWLHALPETVIRARPALCVIRAWSLIDRRDPNAADEYLQRAEAVLETHGAEDVRKLRADIAAVRANVWGMRGDAPKALSQARAALDTLAALDNLDDGNITARSLATMGMGFALLYQGAPREAAEAFRAGVIATRGANNAYAMLLAAMGESYAMRAAGALGRAIAICEEAVRWSEERSHPSPMVGTLYAALADILRERNQLDLALDCVTRGMALANEPAGREGRWLEWQLFGQLVLGRIKQAQGDLDGALLAVAHARERLGTVQPAPIATLFDAFAAQVRLAQGDIEAAVRWAQSTQGQEEPRLGLSPQFYVYAYEHLAIAPIQALLARGRVYGDRVALDRALGLLAQQGQQAERCGLLWRRIKALALQALALEALGETAGALAALEQAVVLAEPERYVRLFVDEGPPMRGLLRQLQARGSPAQYSTSLLRAFGPEGSMNRPSSPPGSVGSIEPPTEPQPWCSRPPWLFPIA